MAWEESLVPVSRPAAVDLSNWNTYKYTVLKLDANGAVTPVTASGDVSYGVLLNDPKAGQAARVAIGGVTKVRLGATVTAGALVAFDTAGKGKVAATGNRVIGVAVYGGVSGDIVPVLLQSQYLSA